MLRTALLIVAGVFAVAVWSGQAAAWGTVGHRVVCQIAYDELTDPARAEVDRLIGLDSQYDNFADSCVWPDRIEEGRGDEHYVTVPRDFDRFDRAWCPEDDRCVVTAIGKDAARLGNASDDTVKLATLKFLGHFVADIHQPVHVVYDDDEGGHRIRTTGVCNELSFHDAWDVCILHVGIGTDVAAVSGRLRDAVNDDNRTAWIAAPVFEWANESLDLLRQPTVGYCVWIDGRCLYEADNPTFDEDTETEKTVRTSLTYVRFHAPSLEGRLQRAGVRLGHLLNETLGQRP